MWGDVGKSKGVMALADPTLLGATEAPPGSDWKCVSIGCLEWERAKVGGTF